MLFVLLFGLTFILEVRKCSAVCTSTLGWKSTSVVMTFRLEKLCCFTSPCFCDSAVCVDLYIGKVPCNHTLQYCYFSWLTFYIS